MLKRITFFLSNKESVTYILSRGCRYDSKNRRCDFHCIRLVSLIAPGIFLQFGEYHNETEITCGVLKNHAPLWIDVAAHYFPRKEFSPCSTFFPFHGGSVVGKKKQCVSFQPIPKALNCHKIFVGSYYLRKALLD